MTKPIFIDSAICLCQGSAADRSGYEAELNNGLDLKFSSKGIFKAIDD